MTVVKVLLAEDHQSWRDILKERIHRAVRDIGRLDITVVRTFDEAFEVLKQNSWHLLITNVALGEDFYATRQKLGMRLVDLAHDCQVPTIVVSGMDEQQLTRRHVRGLLRKYTATDFFEKEEFDDQDFIKKVQELVQQISDPQISLPRYDLGNDDKQYLINTLASLAATAGIPPKEYFRDIVDQLSLPDIWKNEIVDIWIGNTNIDARKLINWVEIRRSYPRVCNKPDYTVLGCLVERLIEQKADEYLLTIVVRYELIANQEKVDELRKFLS